MFSSFVLFFFFSLVLFDLFVLVQAGSNRCWKGGLLVLQKWEQKKREEKKRRKKTPKSLAVGERVDEHDLFLNFLSIFFYFFSTIFILTLMISTLFWH